MWKLPFGIMTDENPELKRSKEMYVIVLERKS